MRAAFLCLSGLICAFLLVLIFLFKLILQMIRELCLFVLLGFVQLLFISQKEVLSFCDSNLSFHLFFFTNLTQFFYIYLSIEISLAEVTHVLNSNTLATFVKINLN